MTATADFGLIGLGVMGENLVLNVESRGFTAAVYNRTTDKVDAFVNGRGAGKRFVGCHTLEQFVASLKRPRKIMILVKAGKPVDQVIESLLPHLEQGDIIIDGGNSYWPDTTRRCKELTAKGILYVGSGVSGGEEGALKGPSMMPGGNPAAWPHIKPIFQAIAAKVNESEVACDWVGDEGAGHFIKMVHNGIEYGDIQVICEAYHLMRDLLKMTPDEIGATFDEWNKGDLSSYLIEITAEIFKVKDEKTGDHMVNKILDVAGQKGTGRWTVVDGLEVGEPITLIAEAVFARNISALKDERVAVSGAYPQIPVTANLDRAAFLKALHDGVLTAKMISYAQGFAMIDAMAKAQGWNINKGAVALMWRAGCIIRSVFLGRIRDAFANDPKLKSLLLNDWFKAKVTATQGGLRTVLVEAIKAGIPTPALSTALAYFDGYRNANLPANLLQAQRDYFGAHTYERTDGPRGEFHHTNWTGEGGTTTAASYNA
ncbi:decarboxylating NADP(+)-dependent phosphogluconate dehydrogenase [bacterium]|nr:decarboxylating NADP(+)-dependent phosphogluconate dehydrogenase [bacterium]